MKFTRLSIPDVVLIEPQKLGDERGFFAEIYKSTDFEQFGIDSKFVQVNHSRSAKNVIRGLHYQKEPFAQSKLVRVLQGEILDVAVDIRKDSPHYGKWTGWKLDSVDMKMLYIPEGFAHGFCVISDFADIEYLCSNIYAPEYEAGIIYNDPSINIDWNINNPILSKKDLKYNKLK